MTVYGLPLIDQRRDFTFGLSRGFLETFFFFGAEGVHM